MDNSFIAFLGVSAVVIMTPGQDTALTIRNTLLGGRVAGIATAGGVATGQAVWTLAASLGLTAVLVASESVFAIGPGGAVVSLISVPRRSGSSCGLVQPVPQRVDLDRAR